jgi:hypothetical protein
MRRYSPALAMYTSASDGRSTLALDPGRSKLCMSLMIGASCGADCLSHQLLRSRS